MDLTNPAALWWLAGLPLLWWLARPARPRRALVSAHLRQWLRARERLRRRPVRFRWLRFVLLATAASCCVLAAAGLRVGAAPGPTRLIVVVDGSASMGATVDGRSAQDAALTALESGLAAIPAEVAVAAVLADAPLTLDVPRPELVATLRGRVPSGVAGPELAELAARVADPDTAVWTLTDGIAPAVVPDSGALSLVGGAAANVAIVGRTVEDAWPLPDVRVVVTVQSFAPQPRRVRVAVTGPVAPTETVVDLAPGERVDVPFDLQRTGGGRLELRLVHEASDALAADDLFAVDLPAPPAPDIAVLRDAESGPWIDVAARTLAAETGGRVLPPNETGRAGFILVDGGMFKQPAGSMRFVTFGARRDDKPLQPRDLVRAPALLDWHRTHPITAGLDLSELHVAVCLRTDFVGAGEALLEAEHGPMAVVSTGPEHTSVHVSFRLGDSNLPQLAAFPQFLRRCYVAAWRRTDGPVQETPLVPAESDLRTAVPRGDRPLPAFGRPGRSLVVWLLALAALLLAVRVYT